MRKRYYGAGLILLVCALLSLFLRLDPANTKLILKEVRIPRLVLALSVGGALGLAGSVLQTVLSNPLADPYTLGISSGAALGAVIGASLGVKLNFFGLNAGAVLVAIAVVIALYKLLRGPQRDSDSVILIGIMLSLAATGCIAIWMSLIESSGGPGILFWLLGDLSRVSLVPALALTVLTSLVCGYFFYFSKKLDAFLVGEDLVESFGISLVQTQRISVILISVLIGFCVSAAGVIGFVSLIVPHLARKLLGTSRHEHVLPFSVIIGAIVLVFCDVLAKSISAQHEIPVGAITAAFGAPAFIALYIRRKKGEIT